MIAHQTIAPPTNGVALAILAQQLQVNRTFCLRMENDSPAIAPLYHMMRQSYRNHAWILPTRIDVACRPTCSQKLVE